MYSDRERSPRVSYPHLAAALFLACSAPLAAQNAVISGVVHDGSEAAVPRAVIVIVNQETGIKRSLASNEAGSYLAPSLIPGIYSVTVTAPGFQTAAKEKLKLEVGQNATVDFRLEVGQVGQTINVESRPEMVNAADGSVSTMVTRDFVEDMPLNGRSFNTLVELTPGAVMVPTNENSRGTFAINGQRNGSNYYMIDGVSANVGVGSSAGLGQGGGGGTVGTSALGSTNNLVGVDSLQEFRISTSTYAPEYGRAPGGQIAVATRSGGNQFHGALFEYLRNDKLDANDWFANRARIARAAERQNDFGGVLGGPIVRNRTFFFVAYEGLRLRQPATLITDVPSLALRKQGSPALQAVLNMFALPTGPDEIDPKTGKLNGFAPAVGTVSNPSTLDAPSLRVDHMVNAKNMLFGRYNYAPSVGEQRGALSAGLSSRVIFDSGLQTATAGLVSTVTPAVTNDFRGNYSWAEGHRHFASDTLDGAAPAPDSLLFPPGHSSADSFFNFKINSGLLTGLTVGNLAHNTSRHINLVDSLSVVRGLHQFRFGFDWRRVNTTTQNFNVEDLASFNDTGTINNVNGTVLSGLGTASLFTTVDGGIIFNSWSAFAQDAWKVRARLTITYGVRWDMNPSPDLSHGHLFALTQIADPSALALAPAGTPLYHRRARHLAPRLGIAYMLSRSRRWSTVLRSGFGMFYDTGFGRLPTLLTTPPLNASATLTNVLLPLAPTAPLPQNLTTPPFTNFVGVDPHLGLPRTYQWNFSVEQVLGGNQSLIVSYVGAAGRDLFTGEQWGNLNNNFQGGTILLTNNSISDYHALQAQYQRRFLRGFQALLSYSWAHATDTSSNDFTNITHAPGFYPRQNHASADFDVRHSFIAAIVYRIPAPHFARTIFGGWSVDPLVRARSALPVDITNSRTVGKISAVTRVNLVNGQPLVLDAPGVPGGRRFNPAAFTIPNGFVQGTFGRNVVRAFDFAQLDAAVHRRFPLSERFNLQLRGEFFNALNHPVFASPNGAYSTSATFGVPTSMLGKSLNSASAGGFNALYQVGGPRSVQMSLRLQF